MRRRAFWVSRPAREKKCLRSVFMLPAASPRAMWVSRGRPIVAHATLVSILLLGSPDPVLYGPAIPRQSFITRVGHHCSLLVVVILVLDITAFAPSSRPG